MPYVDNKRLNSHNVRGVIYHAATAPTTAPWVPDIALPPIDLSRGEEEVAALGGANMFSELTLPRTTSDYDPFMTKITPKPYDIGLRVLEQEMRRDRTGLLKKRLQMNLVSVRERWPILITQKLEVAGESIATANLCADGKPLFATDHAQGSSGAQSNKFTKDVGDPAALTDTEAADLIWNATQKMSMLKDDKGNALSVPNDFLIMAHPVHKRALYRAVREQLVIEGSVVKTNDLRKEVSGFGLNLVLNERLTSQTAIYIFARDGLTFLTGVEYEPIQESLAEGTQFAVENLAHAHFIRFSLGVQPFRWESTSKTVVS